jgi:hypothetical protein
VFSLYVVKTERGRKILLSPSGKPLQKEGNVYWNQASSGGYSVTQQFGDNVILTWQAGEERKLDDRFRGLAAAVQAAVTGKTANIKPEEQQCQAVGIDPAKGPKEGTCRLEAMKLTVVNGASRLQTPVLAAQIKGVSPRPTRSSPTASSSIPSRRAGASWSSSTTSRTRATGRSTTCARS